MEYQQDKVLRSGESSTIFDLDSNHYFVHKLDQYMQSRRA